MGEGRREGDPYPLRSFTANHVDSSLPPSPTFPVQPS